jgi:hypothetical protein
MPITVALLDTNSTSSRERLTHEAKDKQKGGEREERVREENNMEIERNACFYSIEVLWLLKGKVYLFSRDISNK